MKTFWTAPLALLGLVVCAGAAPAEAQLRSPESYGKEGAYLHIGGFNGFNQFENNSCLGVSLDALYMLPTGSISDLRYVQFGWGIQHRF